jgi:hypothetical protein
VCSRAPRAQGIVTAAIAATALAAAAFFSYAAIPEPSRLAIPEPPPSALPVLAAEDTIPVPSATLPEYVVRAPRVTLDEILRRVAEGEARRDSLMRDQAFTRVALVTYVDERGGSRHELDEAARVYRKRPDRVREDLLRRRREGKPQEDGNLEVSAEADMGEEIVSFAFEPRARAGYRFHIAERHVIGGHVVYVVDFTPRSAADALPTGRAWIDTNDFVIVREEFWFRDRSPAPLFLKSVDRCVIERRRVGARWWVVERVLGRVRLTSATRLLGRLGGDKLPEIVDFSLLYTDYRINEGLPDSLFAGGVR